MAVVNNPDVSPTVGRPSTSSQYCLDAYRRYLQPRCGSPAYLFEHCQLSQHRVVTSAELQRKRIYDWWRQLRRIAIQAQIDESTVYHLYRHEECCSECLRGGFLEGIACVGRGRPRDRIIGIVNARGPADLRFLVQTECVPENVVPVLVSGSVPLQAGRMAGVEDDPHIAIEPSIETVQLAEG